MNKNPENGCRGTPGKPNQVWNREPWKAGHRYWILCPGCEDCNPIRKEGHKALRWNNEKQTLETFDPNPNTPSPEALQLVRKIVTECWDSSQFPETYPIDEKKAAQEIQEAFNRQREELNKALETLEELADLMDQVRTGEYKPDTFTTQPARTLLSKKVPDDKSNSAKD